MITVKTLDKIHKAVHVGLVVIVVGLASHLIFGNLVRMQEEPPPIVSMEPVPPPPPAPAPEPEQDLEERLYTRLPEKIPPAIITIDIPKDIKPDLTVASILLALAYYVSRKAIDLAFAVLEKRLTKNE